MAANYYFAGDDLDNVYYISAPSTLQLSSSTLSVTQGTPVTLTAALSSPEVGGPPFSGNVQFTINNGVSGNIYNAPIVNNQAQLVTNTAPNLLPTGTATVTANFAGSGTYGPSSNNVPLSVSPGPGNDFSLTANPTSLSIFNSDLGTFIQPVMITVIPANGFSQLVNLSCSFAPAGVTGYCNFSNLQPGPGVTSNVSVKIMPYASSTSLPIARQAPPASPRSSPGTWTVLIALLMASVWLFTLDRKRRLVHAAAALLLVICIAGVFACGGGGVTSTPPPTGATYTVTVIGTSGTLTHTTSFTVNVTN